MPYLPTGNETVALPTLRSEDAGVDSLNVLHMGLKGLVSFAGNAAPFLRPVVRVDGVEVPLEGALDWRRLADWVPEFTLDRKDLSVRGAWVCPPGERGFYLRLRYENRGPASVEVSLGFVSSWSEALHTINVTKRLEAERFLVVESWERKPVLELRGPAPLAALAFYPEDPEAAFTFKLGGEPLLAPKRPHRRGTPATGLAEVFVHGRARRRVESGKTWETAFFFGLGPDEIGAFASAREMQRVGLAECERRAAHFFAARHKTYPNPRLTHLANLNAFFNRFYATGVTLDTEEVVALTSRSPRYYVSGAYWDRDTLLWSFPSLLEMDPPWAREVLGYVFRRQGRHFGEHSRYLDGTVLEPGFELDELCAPLIALARYVRTTGDRTFLKEPRVSGWLGEFPRVLEAKRHPCVALYETWLLPSDDPWPQRYVTYDNVLVWRALMDLAFLLGKAGRRREARVAARQAGAVRKAIARWCVVREKGKKVFAWSVDLEGGHRLYDEPPGSLLLLPYHGFCRPSDPVWRATERWIHSEANPYAFRDKPLAACGCAHAAHPWVLGAVNDLLSGNLGKAASFFSRADMDGGIACESVDEETGRCATGEAFATCAGFVAHGLWTAFGRHKRKGRDA